jgi:hypothetical protein
MKGLFGAERRAKHLRGNADFLQNHSRIIAVSIKTKKVRAED